MDKREIDVLVAEVLGWKPRTVSEYPFGERTFVVYDGPNGECMQPGVSYRFSDDWVAAGLIVQAMRRGHNGHVAATIKMIVLDHIPPNDCYCHIYGPDLKGGEASADEMPMAISLAFLRAFGREVE